MLKYIDCKCKQAGIAFAGDIKVKNVMVLNFWKRLFAGLIQQIVTYFCIQNMLGPKHF